MVTGEPDVGRLVCEMLQLDGHAVTGAPDGRGGVRSLVASLPDVLVIDARLPDVSGVEVVRALRQAPGGGAVNVVLLCDDPSKVSAAAQVLRISRVVTKPVSLLDLSDVVRAVAPATASRRVPPPSPSPTPPSRGRTPLPDAYAQKPREPMPLRTGHPRTAPPGTPLPLYTRTPTAPPGTPLPARPSSAPPAPAHERLAAPAGRVVPPPASSVAAAAQLLVRLKREVKLVEEADAWTALGVPRRSQAALVAKAVERLRARYAPLTRDAQPEVRELAARILKRIDAAAADTGLDLVVAAAEDDGLAEGRRLLERGEWEAADAFYEAARDARPDSASAMAGLGWARFHNPRRPQTSREDDGASLIQLALTFEAGLPDAWYWLAAITARRGDRATAMTHVQKALRLDPIHAGATELLRELRAAMPPEAAE
ncbi:MAG: response regulator [Myxococcota bacterium]